MQGLITRRRVACCVDCCLQIQFNKEKEYWIKVLRRVVPVVKFLSSRGMAFRSENENIGSQHNGNYLGVLELIAQCNPFLSSHLAKYGNQGRGRPSCLLSTISEEIIEIMVNQVLAVIVKELQQSKYFSVSIDSTPDISHIDQLTIVVRYNARTILRQCRKHVGSLQRSSGTHLSNQSTCKLYSRRSTVVKLGAVETCIKALSFFGLVQKLFNFFLR